MSGKRRKKQCRRCGRIGVRGYIYLTDPKFEGYWCTSENACKEREAKK